MAITLKNAMSRMARTIDPAILRQETITVNRDGTIVDPNKILNLGYQGDQAVTQINVELPWDLTRALFTSYSPALVFTSQDQAHRYTLPLTNEGSVAIPRSITEVAGNYLVYFLLSEKMDKNATNSSYVGPEDEPAYREVFVSAPIKGVVQPNPAYSLLETPYLKDVVYNYNLRGITLADSEWEPEDGKYKISVYLGGCEADSADDINIVLPTDSPITVNIKTYQNKELSLTVSLDDSVEDLNILETITIVYPVDFTVSGDSLKTPITIQHLSVDPKTNKSIEISMSTGLLGMHMDSYVTPIKAEGLHTIPEATKYVLFWQTGAGQPIYVCTAQEDNNFWIPIEVTYTSGNWNIAFASELYTENDKLIRAYYTPVLIGNVQPNELIRDDILNDQDMVPVVASADDGTLGYLWDYNSVHQIYAQPTGAGSQVVLNYTGTQINTYLGWVEEYHQTINTTIAEVADIQTNISTLAGQVNDIADSITSLEDKDTELVKKDSELEESISTLNTKVDTNVAELQEQIDAFAETDVGDLIDRMETAEADIDSLQTRVNSAETQINNHTNTISSHTQTINSHTQSINDLIPRMTTAEADIELNSRNIFTNTTEISSHNVRISTLEEKQEQTNIKLVDLQSAIDSKHETTQALINVETAARKEADQELQTQIDSLVSDLSSEVSRSTAADEQHTTGIAAINTNIDAINTNIDTIETNLNGLQGQHNSLKTTVATQQTFIERHDSSIESLNSTAVRNNYNVDIATPFVAKIVFLSSEADYQALVDAGTVETNTLYLIQEEEE